MEARPGVGRDQPEGGRMSQKIGIVGHAADKFSLGARESARKAIREVYFTGNV
jgi:hypothetical protein